MREGSMKSEQVHDDKYMNIFWNSGTRILRVDWKEGTGAMTTEDFKASLTQIAAQVESRRAAGLLVDVDKFRHRPEPEVHKWRVENISPRYDAAGLRRFAFLFPAGAQIPSAMNQSGSQEKFLTRAFDEVGRAESWLTAD